MKFLFWLMNFKILSGEINETNFYETAEKIARQIDPSWKWRKQELGALRYRVYGLPEILFPRIL